jgi:hypothetical protein
MICGLKQIPIDKITSSVLSFQALSYAWGKGAANDVIMLSNIQNRSASSNGEEEMSVACHFLIRANLLKALRRIRHPKQYVWIWADALCIDQSDKADKGQQIPNMPDIYSNAWNVIVWLGDDESGSKDSVR